MTTVFRIDPAGHAHPQDTSAFLARSLETGETAVLLIDPVPVPFGRCFAWAEAKAAICGHPSTSRGRCWRHQEDES